MVIKRSRDAGFTVFFYLWHVYDQGQIIHTGKTGCHLQHQLKWGAE
jgi:hypothetical protein